VVVVVMGAGTVVCCVVVVVLLVGLSVSQPFSKKRAATAMHDRMMVFMFVFVVLIICSLTDTRLRHWL
jgi:Ca2+/Na+ antiporter